MMLIISYVSDVIRRLHALTRVYGIVNDMEMCNKMCAMLTHIVVPSNVTSC